MIRIVSNDVLKAFLAVAHLIIARLDNLRLRWLSPTAWGTYHRPEGIHVAPIRDDIAHVLTDDECICGPTFDWNDDHGGTLTHPVITHHSLDGREQNE